MMVSTDTPLDRYEIAAQIANDGFWEWDLSTGRFTVSPRCLLMLGIPDPSLLDNRDAWVERTHPAEAEKLQHALEASRQGSVPLFELSCRIRHQSGNYRWMNCRGMTQLTQDGRPVRVIGVLTDIADNPLSAGKQGFELHYSSVTGLPNRTLLMSHLEGAIARAHRHPSYLFAVLFLDLDGFKYVNESLGHLTGDRLLVALAERLKHGLRANDTIAHLGGDEFVILLDGIRNLSDATLVADRIQHSLESPFLLGDQPVFLSISTGITLSQPDYRHPEELLRDAHIAMNRAKEQGKARYAMFDSKMHRQAVCRLRMEAELREALQKDQFEIYYQPILSLTDGSLTHVEALIRWHHPERGFVLPGEFIPVAEDTGLIVPIGEWVLQHACTQVQAWRSDSHLTLGLSVNISARQFQQPDLVQSIQNALQETGFPAAALVLEVTESTAMQNVEQSIHILNELTLMGIRISIDDFGTGYSSLASLKRLPIHTLKVDRSFVKDAPEDEDDVAITAAIIAMAHRLHLNVVAEGIETQEQAELLRGLHCDEGQGYLFSRPLPAAELIASMA